MTPFRVLDHIKDQETLDAYVGSFVEDARREALEEAAKVAGAALKCLSCGYVGPWKECCDNMNIDSATQDDVARAIRALIDQAPS